MADLYTAESGRYNMPATGTHSSFHTYLSKIRHHTGSWFKKCISPFDALHQQHAFRTTSPRCRTHCIPTKNTIPSIPLYAHVMFNV